MDLIADTNWMIKLQDEFRRQHKGPARQLLAKKRIFYNIISRAEFLSGNGSPQVIKILQPLPGTIKYEDGNKAARLRKDRLRAKKPLHLPDALMAVCAIRHGMTLLTADKDFSGIPGLKCSDYGQNTLPQDSKP